jgi:hypothetical protein
MSYIQHLEKAAQMAMNKQKIKKKAKGMQY